MDIPTVSIYRIPISKLGMDDTVRYLTDAVQHQIPHQVITVNPIMVMTALEQPEYMAMMRNAELVVPDGTGVVWAADYIKNPVAERVPGFDLLHRLLEVGQQYGWKVYLLGSSPDIIRETAKRIQERYPDIKLVGYRDGYFTSDQDDEVIAHIREAAPDLLFVGRSAGNQEPWIGQYKDRLQVPVMMGIGGCFDIIAGKLKRAPVLFQRMRLEWLYRLLQEPRRYRRMLVLPKFVVKVILEQESVKK